MAEKRVRTDKFSKEWWYAKQCWTALVNNESVPPIPSYTMYESIEGVGKEKIIGHKPIDPKRITCNGITLYG